MLEAEASVNLVDEESSLLEDELTPGIDDEPLDVNVGNPRGRKPARGKGKKDPPSEWPPTSNFSIAVLTVLPCQFLQEPISVPLATFKSKVAITHDLARGDRYPEFMGYTIGGSRELDCTGPMRVWPRGKEILVETGKVSSISFLFRYLI